MLWTDTYLLMRLRFTNEFATQLLEGVQNISACQWACTVLTGCTCWQERNAMGGRVAASSTSPVNG